LSKTSVLLSQDQILRIRSKREEFCSILVLALWSTRGRALEQRGNMVSLPQGKLRTAPLMARLHVVIFGRSCRILFVQIKQPPHHINHGGRFGLPRRSF
jgi:hypothetical protein